MSNVAADSLFRNLGIVALAAGLAALQPSPAPGGDDRQNVLILYPFGRLLPANADYGRGIHEGLANHGGPNAEVFEEFLDLARFTHPSYVDALETYLSEKYASQPPDVIVVGVGDGLRFLVERRAGLFPTTPIVHAAVGRDELDSMSPLPADIVGAPSDPDFSGTIATALRLHPSARHLLLVTGQSTRDLLLAGQLREAARAFEPKVQVEELARIPLSEVLAKIRSAGSQTVVVTPGLFVYGDGRPTNPTESGRAIATGATAPVYHPYTPALGTGVVGGSMTDFHTLGYEAGREAGELLRGTDPGDLEIPRAMESAVHLDWRQLRRWGIDERRIPPDAVVHFRPPSLLQEHRSAVIVVVAIVAAQAVLISLLLAERRRRRKAEIARDSLRGELTHASRLAVAGELIGSIAHEINQPLGAILANADAAKLLLAKGPEQAQELDAALSEIRNADLRASEIMRRLRALLAKKEVERQRFDLHEAAREVKALLIGEARRRGVTLEIDTEPAPKTVEGDRIQIQQVMINLLINAMDAVAERPAGRRSVRACVETTTTNAVLVVRDNGPGLGNEQLPRLFDSFYTTKRAGLGLGLSIARTIVEAHDGSIGASNHDGGGAEFRVALPLAANASAAMRPA